VPKTPRSTTVVAGQAVPTVRDAEPPALLLTVTVNGLTANRGVAVYLPPPRLVMTIPSDPRLSGKIWRVAVELVLVASTRRVRLEMV